VTGLEQHRDQAVAPIRDRGVGGQLLAEDRPLVGKVGGREHDRGEAAVSDGALELLDHRGARTELLLGQYPVGRQPERGERVARYPPAVGLGMADEQIDGLAVSRVGRGGRGGKVHGHGGIREEFELAGNIGIARRLAAFEAVGI
jgi:hypothetical protein